MQVGFNCFQIFEELSCVGRVGFTHIALDYQGLVSGSQVGNRLGSMGSFQQLEPSKSRGGGGQQRGDALAKTQLGKS